MIVFDTPLYLACIEGPHVASVHFKQDNGRTVAYTLESTGNPSCLAAVLSRVARMPGLLFTVDERNPRQDRLKRLYMRRIGAKKLGEIYEVPECQES